ncbi:MAG TPA: TonB family protein [Candidatus Acidoferrum sp.]|nr:TonB family protein [Candidatus Acidoferrum sp.]
MFDDLVVSGAQTKHTHKTWTVAASAIVQVMIIVVFILIPLLVTQALPKEAVAAWITAPAPPPPPPPPPPKVQVIHQAPPLIQQGKLMAPTVIPKKVNIIKEEAPPPDVTSGMTGGVAGGIGGGSMGGVLGGIIGSTGGGPPPPPKAPERIRVGGNVQQANLIHEVQPIYPEIAKTAHIQGTVLLHAIIAKDGTIKQLQYISGPPLLMRNALSAVQQWRYRPTLLNGEPVEVETTISVVFTLGG